MRGQDQGVYAEQLKRGTIIDGRRVVAMSPVIVNGQRGVSVRFATTVGRKRRKALTAPVTYLCGRRVPGTRPSTTWSMPAGPVGRKPGGTLHGGWYGDADDTGRDARTNRHARMIDSLTYA